MRSGLRLEPGQQLGERYRLVEPIGVGGMGEVWRGLDERLRRPVAIKILPAELSTDEAAVQRFRREAETTASLQHPGITVMFDIDEHPYGRERLVFLVMELLSGWDLRTALAQPGALPIDQAASVTAQVADALAAAHSRGVIHRDIKPANLFLLTDGRVKICDFGIARLADTTTRLTASGGLIGTPLYMAPEQFRGEPLDPRADLYALGCVLYEMLVGESPFDADTAAVIMYRHLNDAPAPPRSLRSDIPEHLEQLALDLLAKDPAERPPSAAAVVASLRESGTVVSWPVSMPADASPTPAVPVPAYEPAPPTARPQGPQTRPRIGRRGGAVLATVAAVAVITGGAFAAVNALGDDEAEPPANDKSAAARPAPVVPGWQVMPAPGYGVAYDVPPGWKVEKPGTYLGFDDYRDDLFGRAAVSLLDGKCTRAFTGLRGGSDPVLRPPGNQMAELSAAASTEAVRWADAAYDAGRPPAPRRLPKIDPGGTRGTITVNGIVAARRVVAVTKTAKSDNCTPPQARVETLAIATKQASTLGPLIFVVVADRGVPGQVGDDVLTKIVSTVRPYHCPPGTKTHADNKCSAASSTPPG